MADKVMHFEIHGKDGKRLQEFYASLFGWKIDANNPMQYGLVSPEPGGILESRPGELVSNRLEFFAPFAATNEARFDLAPNGTGTRVGWSM